MSVEALPKISPYVEDPEDFAHIQIIWLANLVGTMNSALDIINTRLVALGG